MPHRSRVVRRSAVVASLSAVALTAALTGSVAPAAAQGAPEAGNPAVTIVKVADQATVVAGDPIDYHLTVTNTGDVPLTGVTIIDPKAPDCAGPVTDLLPTDDVVVDCSYTTIDPDDVGTYSNAAVVTSDQGALALSETVNTTVEAPLSELTVAKTADETTVIAGDDIHFHVEVTNSGNQPLTGVSVTDAVAPDCDSAVGPMAPDASTTIDCTYTTDAGDVGTVSNVASVVSDQTTSIDSNQVDVTVTAESFALTATMSVDQSQVVASEDLDYHLELENTGNRTLTGIVVTDTEVPDCDGPVADLAPGASTTVDCTYTTSAPDVGTFANSASVASNELPAVVSNEVTSTVVAAAPAITIAQTADQTSVFASQDIDLHLTLHNTGNQTLTGIVITDVEAPDCAGPVPDLAAGATTVVDCTYTTVLDDDGTWTNTASVDTNQTTPLASNQVSVTVTVPQCGPGPVTVSLAEGDVPTEGDDAILGTANADVINALGGNDFVCALGGDDQINGGGGADFIAGMNGSDTIDGGNGVDYLLGELEFPTTNPGGDTITGGGGNDYIDSGPGDDVIDGGIGNDRIVSRGGNDTADGGDGNDIVRTYGGDDEANGGPGNDSVFGDDGADTLHGGSGDDNVLGGPGKDHLSGEGGVDFLSSGTSADTADGGAGNDTVDGNDGDDVLQGGTGNDLVRGGNHNDTVSGGDGDDKVLGDAGNDRIFGNAGMDRLSGGSGNDRLSGGTGSDGCFGDSGADAADNTCDATVGIP